MLKVPSRAELDRLTGQKPKPEPAPVPAPAPAPVITPPPAPPQDPALVERMLGQLVEQQRQTSQAVEKLASRPQGLEAEIVRDLHGRMTKIIIQFNDRK